MIFRLLFTQPGLPTRARPSDEQIMVSFGNLTKKYKAMNRDLLSDSLIEEAVSKYGVTLISSRFKKIFIHSKERSVVANIIMFIGPLFRRFTSIRRLARQFQIDKIHIPLIRMLWRLVDAVDSTSWDRSVTRTGLDLIIL